MKRIFYFLSAFAAIVAVSACNKEVNEIEVPVTGNEKVVKFKTAPETKTVFGTASGNSLPTLWTDTYGVALSLNLANAKKSTTPVVGNDGTTASFEATIEDDKSGAYAFYAISPYEAYVSASASYKSIQFTVPTSQTSLDASPDEKAQILYGTYDAGSSFPSSVTMGFKHITAYGKISFSNLSLAEGESVASISLTAAENWAGRYYYYTADSGEYAAGDITANSASNTITITTNKTSDIWFGCAPVDLGGKTVDVVITTNTGTTYSKTITIPAGKKFSSGVVNAFTVNMSGISSDDAVVYTLVKDAADLTLGSEVIIVGKGDDVNLAMSTTQNANNRSAASITKSVDESGNAIVSSPGVDVQVLTIANGNKGGTYALSSGSGYLNAASSSNNYLKTEETLSDNSSWTISIAADGEATITSIGNYSRNYMRCNTDSNVFACYASGATTGVAVLIYKKNDTGSGAINPKVPASLSITGATTTYDVDGTFSFDGTVDLVYSDKSTESLLSSDYTVDDSAVDMITAGTYTVVVKYNDDNSIVGTYQITVSESVIVTSPYSLTPNQANTGSTSTSYITTLTEFTYNGVSWKMNQWNPKTLQIKTNQSSAASEFRFYNTSAFPGRISKVVITFSALTVSDASKLMFLGGISEVTATTGGTAGTWDSDNKTLTWTPGESDNFTYFAFYQNGKAASGTNNLANSDAIVVTFE